MNGMEMGFAYEPLIYGDKRDCPAWVSAEQFYNCENFSATLERSGFNIERLFHHSERTVLPRV